MGKDKKLEETQDLDAKAIRNASSQTGNTGSRKAPASKEISKGGSKRKNASSQKKKTTAKKPTGVSKKKNTSSSQTQKRVNTPAKSASSAAKKQGSAESSNKIRRFPKEEAQNRSNGKKTSAKRKKRKNRIKGIAMFSLACIVVLASLVVFGISQLYKIKTITVNYDLNKTYQSEKVSRKYTDEQIINASGVELGDNLVLIKYRKTDDIVSSVSKSLPFLNVVSVESKGMSNLILNVKQIKPVYAFVYGESYILTDDSLHVIDKTQDSKTAGQYTVVKYTDVASCETGAKIEFNYVSGQENVVESFMAAVKAAGMNKITYVSFKNVDDMYMTYDNRILVHVGSRDNIVAKLKLAAKSLAAEDKNSTQQKGTLNMTIDNKAYFTSE